MSEESLVFELLEEERKSRIKRIAKDKKIATEDCLVIGILTLNKEISGLKVTVNGLKNDVIGLKNDVTSLKNDVASLKEDVNGLKKDVAGLKDDVASLKGDVVGLKGDMSSLKTDVVGLRNELRSNFRWSVGLMLGMWCTIMASLIPILLRLIGVI